MKRKQSLIVFLVFSLAGLPLRGGSPGSAGASFLKLGSGARTTGMADTQAALADDAFGAYWNPAALALIRSGEAGFSHNRSFEDVTHQYAVLAQPFGSVGTASLGATRVSVEDFLGFDANGVNTGVLSSGALAASLGFGRTLLGSSKGGAGLKSGAAVQFLQEENANVKKTGLAADIGLLYRPSDQASELFGQWVRRLSMGFAVRRLGQGLKFDNDTSPLPIDLVGGLGYRFFMSGDVLILGGDFHTVTDEDAYFTAGGEYWYRRLLALRAGYRSNQDSGSGLRFGGGLRLRRLQIDYAWAGFGEDLGVTHRVSVLWRYGRRKAATSPGLPGDLFDYYVKEGKKKMKLGLHDQAVLDLNRALAIRPEDNEVLRLLLEAGDKMREMAPPDAELPPASLAPQPQGEEAAAAEETVPLKESPIDEGADGPLTSEEETMESLDE